MSKRCAILGASGHGKVIAEIAELNGYQDIAFFDDRWPILDQIEHWKVYGGSDALLLTAKEFDLTVIAIGNNAIRLSKQRELQKYGAQFAPLYHPSAQVSRYAKVGGGSVVMANAVVNPFVSIGDACIINTSATVDHDCTLSDGVHVSPGSNLAGGVDVGEQSWIGIGSSIKQLITIGSNAVVGAGSAVIHNVFDDQTVVGVPAKSIIIKE